LKTYPRAVSVLYPALFVIMILFSSLLQNRLCGPGESRRPAGCEQTWNIRTQCL